MNSGTAQANLKTLLCLLFIALLSVTGSLAEVVTDASGSQTAAVGTTDQHSEIVKKITFANEPDYACRGIGMINGVMLALVEVQEYGCELWRIEPDGDHTLFADMNEGEHSSGILSGFGTSDLFEGWYYFGAWDENDHYRLWRTDGHELERVQESPPLSQGFWPFSIQTNQVGFNGRNYIEASRTPFGGDFYSTDGSVVVRETQLLQDGTTAVAGYHTLFDKLIVSTRGQVDEAWLFDGNEYSLLRDVATGSFGELQLGLFFYFDEAWVFDAKVPNPASGPESSFFYTDGERVTQIPHQGTKYITTYNALSGYAWTRDYRYTVGTSEPGGFTDGMPVMRIGKHSSSDYILSTGPEPATRGTVAILDDEAYVLADSRLFKLGETEAEEESLELPGTWEGSEFVFAGSDAYFKNAYIWETGSQGDKRIWVWNKSSAELLMNEDGQPILTARWFQHIGNDIYFYGEDAQNGWALRKIPDVVIKRLPELAKVTGAWFDPATPGQGFVLHAIDDERTLYTFYGFEDDGSPLWLTGVGSTKLETGKPVSVDMILASGGKFGSFNPADVTEEHWGTLEIEFQTCSKATATLDGQSGQQSMNIIALSQVEGIDCFYTYNPPKPKTVGITGSWFDPATSGQGFVVQSITDERALITFYGFNNDSERVWLLGVYNGQLDWNQPLELTMITASGGRFGDFSPEDITETPWGTMTLTFEDCENAVASLSGTDGEQTMDLVKLASLQGSDFDCP